MRLLETTVSVVALATLGASQITKVNDFSAGPTKLGMYVHVPKNLKSPAPIVVAVHHCQGSAQGYSTETKYMPLADSKGFIVIYPNSKSSGGCFDVASQASTVPWPSLLDNAKQMLQLSCTTVAVTAKPLSTWSSMP